MPVWLNTKPLDFELIVDTNQNEALRQDDKTLGGFSGALGSTPFISSFLFLPLASTCVVLPTPCCVVLCAPRHTDEPAAHCAALLRHAACCAPLSHAWQTSSRRLPRWSAPSSSLTSSSTRAPPPRAASAHASAQRSARTTKRSCSRSCSARHGVAAPRHAMSTSNAHRPPRFRALKTTAAGTSRSVLTHNHTRSHHFVHPTISTNFH